MSCCECVMQWWRASTSATLQDQRINLGLRKQVASLVCLQLLECTINEWWLCWQQKGGDTPENVNGWDALCLKLLGWNAPMKWWSSWWQQWRHTIPSLAHWQVIFQQNESRNRFALNPGSGRCAFAAQPWCCRRPSTKIQQCEVHPVHLKMVKEIETNVIVHMKKNKTASLDRGQTLRSSVPHRCHAQRR